MKKKTLIIIFMFVAGCGTVKDTEKSSNTLNQVSFEEGIYSVIVDRTELSWIGKEISTKIHTGTLNLTDGMIEIIDENTINGNITIDMSSINVTDLQGRAKEMLEGHLRSADFFEVENYPNATLNFKSKSYNKLKNLIDFEGQLTIKDISNPIFFSATLIESSPYLKAKSILSFDRSKYNVRFRSGSFFENLGDKLILDDIDVNIVLVTEKK
ncbi:MAG: YceI family protein [Candidatus Neomarinimicrobiota bacterium]|nr:YceI family protein [Candidatus Neomarinimicrobiota bacterium]